MYVFVATLPERLQSSLLRYIQSFDACSVGIRSQCFFHHSAMGSPLSFPLMSHLPCIEIVSVITLSSARLRRGSAFNWQRAILAFSPVPLVVGVMIEL